MHSLKNITEVKRNIFTFLFYCCSTILTQMKMILCFNTSSCSYCKWFVSARWSKENLPSFIFIEMLWLEPLKQLSFSNDVIKPSFYLTPLLQPRHVETLIHNQIYFQYIKSLKIVLRTEIVCHMYFEKLLILKSHFMLTVNSCTSHHKKILKINSIYMFISSSP